MKYVVWDTPWPGIDENGNEVTLHVQEKMLASDAVKFERACLYKKGLSKALVDTIHNDILLESFKCIHWATEVDE